MIRPMTLFSIQNQPNVKTHHSLVQQALAGLYSCGIAKLNLKPFMNSKILLCFGFLALNAFITTASAQITVSNIRPLQRAGTKIVDIDYDLVGGSTPLRVNLFVSSNSGTSFDVPAGSLTGAVGNGVMPGTNRRITWDAGADWPGQYSNTMVFRITTDNGTLEVPSTFALIPGGSFEMGDALDGMPDAQLHLVNVSTFIMSKFEVTQAEWLQVKTWALANGYTGLPEGVVINTNGEAIPSNHPIMGIDWNSAVKWCNARTEWENTTLNKALTPCYTIGGAVFRTGDIFSVPDANWQANGYRLPTEAEWEKAARGGLRWKRYPWGNDYTGNEANMQGADLTGLNDTTPVGSYPANNYGLFDMIGNVSEWCWDFYAYGYSFSPSGNVDPIGANAGFHVLRGGQWKDFSITVARRIDMNIYSTQFAGFRIVRRQ